MMIELGIRKYRGYSIMEISVANFLKLDNIPVTPFLIDTYIDDDLSKFVPKTNIEILERFSLDIENHIFDKLKNFYLIFIQKNC